MKFLAFATKNDYGEGFLVYGELGFQKFWDQILRRTGFLWLLVDLICLYFLEQCFSTSAV